MPALGKVMCAMRTYAGTAAAQNAPFLKVRQLRRSANPFGVMAPKAFHRTALKKRRRADPVAIVHRKSLNPENSPCYFIEHEYLPLAFFILKKRTTKAPPIPTVWRPQNAQRTLSIRPALWDRLRFAGVSPLAFLLLAIIHLRKRIASPAILKPNAKPCGIFPGGIYTGGNPFVVSADLYHGVIDIDLQARPSVRKVQAPFKRPWCVGY